MKREDKLSHPKTCTQTMIKCKLCSASVKRELMKRHQSEVCPEGNIKCELCNTTILRKNKEKHTEKCPEFTIECDECKANFKRKEKDAHDCVKFLKGMLDHCTEMFSSKLNEKDRQLKERWA